MVRSSIARQLEPGTIANSGWKNNQMAIGRWWPSKSLRVQRRHGKTMLTSNPKTRNQPHLKRKNLKIDPNAYHVVSSHGFPEGSHFSYLWPTFGLELLAATAPTVGTVGVPASVLASQLAHLLGLIQSVPGSHRIRPTVSLERNNFKYNKHIIKLKQQ